LVVVTPSQLLAVFASGFVVVRDSIRSARVSMRPIESAADESGSARAATHDPVSAGVTSDSAPLGGGR
jgi:hypothetical protein